MQSLVEELLDQLTRIQKIDEEQWTGWVKMISIRKILDEFDESCQNAIIYDCTDCGRPTPNTSSQCLKCREKNES